MERVLIIDCFDSFTFNIFHYLDSLNPEGCKVVRYDQLSEINPSDYSHIVLSPGPGLPADYPQLFNVLNRISPAVPVLGVCLGLQTLVVHFGGKLKRLNQVKHGIDGQLQLNGPSVLLSGLSSLNIGHYHSWVADEESFPGNSLRITSKDQDGNIMSVEHLSLPWHAIQFHPESVLSPSGMQIFKNWMAIKSS